MTTQEPNGHSNSIIKASDETTPLLAGEEVGLSARPVDPALAEVTSNGTHAEDEDAPWARTQIFLLCFIRLVEPIAMFSIFPYINSMIENIGGVQKENVGFYSGLIESLFSATEMSVMIFWGKASDRLGRKPVLVFSLLGISVATALFALSQSIWQIILTRCFAGVFAGTVVTVRAMFSENSTKNSQAKAFSYFAFAGNLGIFVGTLIGGALERPAQRYTSIFGKIRFFHDYPYALPGMVTSAIALCTAILTILFVKETLHTHQGKKMETDAPPMSTRQLLKHPGVVRVIVIYNYVMLLGTITTAVNPLFLYTPVSLGGLGFEPQVIAAAFCAIGILQAVWLLLVFPSLHKRVGTGQILRISAWTWPFFFAVFPGFNFLLRYQHVLLFWTLGIPLLTLVSGISMSFTAVQLAVNDIAPVPETLGTLNGIVLAVQSGLRAVAPVVATSLYATGVKYHILGGHFFWLVLVVLAFGLVVVLKSLPQKVEGKPHQQQNGNS